jgi:ligand-binding SRPBCC domain-containing protein
MTATPARDPAPEIRFTALGDGEHELATVTHLAHPRNVVFRFFSDAANLARITPPELGFRILTPTPIAMAEGTLIDYRLRLFGLPFSWRTRISRWEPPDAFADEQLRGPYARWHHTHTFDAVPGGTRMTDRVRFRLPLGVVGRPAVPVVKLQLRRIFAYRAGAIPAHLSV